MTLTIYSSSDVRIYSLESTSPDRISTASSCSARIRGDVPRGLEGRGGGSRPTRLRGSVLLRRPVVLGVGGRIGAENAKAHAGVCACGGHAQGAREFACESYIVYKSLYLPQIAQLIQQKRERESCHTPSRARTSTPDAAIDGRARSEGHGGILATPVLLVLLVQGALLPHPLAAPTAVEDVLDVRLRGAAAPSDPRCLGGKVRMLKRQARLFRRFEHSIESEQKEAPVDAEDDEFTDEPRKGEAGTGLKDKQWSVVSTTIPIDHSKPFVETVTENHPWKVTREVENIEHSTNKRLSKANRVHRAPGKNASSIKLEPKALSTEPLQPASAIMSQLRAVGLHDKGSGSRTLESLWGNRFRGNNRRRGSVEKEKVISAELRKIIKASSIKYGGAKALMLDDGRGERMRSIQLLSRIVMD